MAFCHLVRALDDPHDHRVAVQAPNCAALGDPGTPVQAVIKGILLETNGDYTDLFRVAYRDRPFNQWREECADLPTYSFRLAVETRNRLRALVERLLRRNGLSHDDVACYISQNLSTSLRNHEEILGAPLAKPCHDNLARYGHLGPNDVFLNLYSVLDQGHLRPGEHAVLLAVSPAAAWSALLIETGPHNEEHHLL
ncbi:MAG: hypothetical protein M3443_14365 [Actinomycetota bacterium]|nr:hypothetical protein [Actinomycetota bacterium]